MKTPSGGTARTPSRQKGVKKPKSGHKMPKDPMGMMTSLGKPARGKK